MTPLSDEIPRCVRPHTSLLDRSLAHYSLWQRRWGCARVRGARREDLPDLQDLVARGEFGYPLEVARYVVRDSPPGPSAWFAKVLRRLGIRCRPANIDRLTILGARCVNCRAQDECKKWLASGQPRDNNQGFCPNADMLQGLACEAAKLAAR